MMTDERVIAACGASLALIFQRGIKQLSAASQESILLEIATRVSTVSFTVKFEKTFSISCDLHRPGGEVFHLFDLVGEHEAIDLSKSN
jgi:hypothetical protein